MVSRETLNPLLARFRPESVHTKLDDSLIALIVRAGFVIYVVGYLLVGRPLRRPRDLPSVLGVRIAVARRSTLRGGQLSVGDSH